MYENQAEIIKALGHKTRLMILHEIKDREICVCKFQEKAKVSMATISKHLSILKKANLVVTRKENNHIFYKLKYPCVLNFLDCINQVLKRENK